MVKFRNGSRRILVATDVAARGIDVDSLALVVNFDFPTTQDVFIHRVGRTGRAGKKGRSLLLVTSRQKGRLPSLEEAYGRSLVLFESGGVSSELNEEITDESSDELSIPEKSAVTLPPTQNAGISIQNWETLQILGGRKDKLRPGDILGALTGEAGGLKSAQVGKIEIQDRHSFVAIEAGVLEHAFASLVNGRLKGRKFKIQKL